MHRLLKLKNWVISDSRVLSHSLNSFRVTKTCAYCQKLNHNGIFSGPTHFQSTNPSLQAIGKKKKRAKRAKKYAELLEVTPKSTLETQASVHNLKAKHLALLTDKPDVHLGELHKIHNVLPKSFSTSENITCFSSIDYDRYNCSIGINPRSECLEEFPQELINDHIDTFQVKDTETSLLLDDPEFHNGILEEYQGDHVDSIEYSSEAASTAIDGEKATNKRTAKAKNVKEETLFSKNDRAAREEALGRILLAYTGLCVAHGKPLRGLQALRFYRERAKRNPNMPKVLNPNVYDCVLEGFASKGNFGRTREVLSLMKENQITPTLQTFVAIFECFGRIKNPSLDHLVAYRSELQSYGFSLNDLIDKGKFIGNRREAVLAAIRYLEPNFSPIYSKPIIQYNNKLVDHLNNNAQMHMLENISKKIKIPDAIMSYLENKTNREIKLAQLNANISDILYRNPNPDLYADIDSFTFNPLASSSLSYSVFNYCDNFTPAFTSDISEYKRFNLENRFEEIYQEIDSDTKANISKKSLTTQQLKEQANQQLQIEGQGYIYVDSIELQGEPTETVIHYRNKLEETLKHWEETIQQCLLRDMASLQAQSLAAGGTAKGSPSLHACLHSLSSEEITEIILQEVRKLAEGSETYSPSMSQLYREIGQLVHSKYQVKLKQKYGIHEKVEHIYKCYCDWYANEYLEDTNLESTENSPRNFNPRQYWQALEHSDHTGPSLNIEDRVWPHSLVVGVGKFLYSIIMQDLKIDVNVSKPKSKQSKLLPAFYSLFRSQGHIIKEEVKAHPAVTKLFRGAMNPKIPFHVSLLPMLCPPRPWASTNAGGYLIVNTEMLRLPPQATQQLQRLASTPTPNLYPSFDSLNQLGAVPWNVNTEILDLVIDIFRNGGNAKLGVSPPPSSCPNPSPLTPNASKVERFQVFRQRMAVKRRRAELYSLWCDTLYRLSLANHFRDNTFWLPHNMDFRGRVYPIPPHLTHLGADLARALLIFAEERPLGPDGLRWLKLHLVNLLGTKKKNSIEERLEYANSKLADILDSADNPLNGNMWWAKSEEPWQTLACCKEIAKAVRSPDPEKCMTQFPVHQDGSCNGLQHYAALGRDAAGAMSVNLIPSERPQDVYNAVAVLVEEYRKKDAEQGVKIAQILDGFVMRKVIKQTVMTTVYGVTRFGARLQIARQLKDIDEFPKDHVWQASSYLTTKTFESLRSMFTSTKEIQDWFTECARLISGISTQNVEWITPLGLPVVQPYNRYRKIDTSNSGKNRISEHFAMDTYERPNVMKQKNAFPPNFIHSLDSTHMMLTSLNCERAGITFVSVHDCFWTHPSTVNIMNKVCREQFVALHSQPILEDLSDFLCRKFSFQESDFSKRISAADNSKRKLNQTLRKLPKTGDFQLENVLDSVYFFS